jgi:hypothetical protein
VQSEANSAAGGFALKFSPREVPCGGVWSWARARGIAHSVSTVANIAAQHEDVGTVGRFIFDNDDLHAVVHDDGQSESGV